MHVFTIPDGRLLSKKLIPSYESGAWGLATGAALLLHLTLSLCFSDEQWLAPIGAGAVCSVGLALSLYRARYGSEVLRFRWFVIAIGFVLWLAGYGAAAGALLAGVDSSRALPFIFVLALCGIPWFVAMVRTSDRMVLPHTRWFDRAQAALLAASTALLFFPHLLADTAVSVPSVSSTLADTYRDVQNGLLALLSVGGILLQPTRQERTFAVRLCVLLVGNAVVSFAVDRTAWSADVTSSALMFLLVDAPVALFIFTSASTPRAEHDGDRLRRTRLHRLLLLLAPALLTGGAMLMGFVIAKDRPLVGAAIGMTALVLYAFRSALTEAAHARTHVALHRAHTRMETLAQLDPLTNIPNRRSFDEALARAWDAALHDGSGLSLLFIDVDAFKAYNDQFGHSAGDACLQRVANTLLNQAQREGDSVARYGGEEFVVILSQSDEASALAIAERMRSEVAAESILHPTSTAGVVTISVGLAHAVPAQSFTTRQDLLERADRALFEAKAAGRNRVALGDMPRLANTPYRRMSRGAGTTSSR